MSAAFLNMKPFLRLHFRLKHSNPRDSIQSAALSKVIPKLRFELCERIVKPYKARLERSAAGFQCQP